MKPVFKCDYCSKMGTEEEIREHEFNCHMRNDCLNRNYKSSNMPDDLFRDDYYYALIGEENYDDLL